MAKIKVCEIVCKVAVCLILLLMFSSVFVYYYIQEYVDTDEYSLNVTSSYNNPSSSTDAYCSMYGIGTLSVEYTENCNDTCIYTGEVCKDVLFAWQNCTSNEQVELNIQPKKSQEILEEFINYLMSNLRLKPNTEECHQVMLSFICLYYFPLYNSENQSIQYVPAKEMCQQIRNTTCYALIDDYNPFILPLQCDTLPSSSFDTDLDQGSGLLHNCSSVTNITCRHDFIEEDGCCRPRCNTWKDSGNYSLFVTPLKIIAAVICLLMIIVCFCFALYDYKKFLKFPVIFITFMLVDFLIIDLSFFITTMRSDLFCSNPRLDISINNPSTFCTISGIIFHYTTLQLALFWLFHICFLFYSTVFQFHAKRTKGTKTRRIIEITIVLIALIFPAVVISIGYIVEDHEYKYSTITTFCTPNHFIYWFYSYIVICNMTLAIGSGLLFSTIYKIHKYQGLFVNRTRRQSQSNFVSISAAEKKLILLFIFVLIFGMMNSVLTMVNGATEKSFYKEFAVYITCERDGYIPGRCDRSKIDEMYSPYLTLIVYSFAGLMPFLAFNFIINWKKLKQICGKNKSSSGSKRSSTKSLRPSSHQVTDQHNHPTLKKLSSRDSTASITMI